MNYYETILAIRNKMFPPVMEIGAEIRIKDWFNNKFIITFITDRIWIRYKEEHIKGRIFKEEWVWLLSDKQVIGDKDLDYAKKYPKCVDDTKKIEILGLPVSLNDILLMLPEEYEDDVGIYSRDDKGKALWLSDDTYVDLTKSIQDQTPKVLSAIIKLIKD